MTTPEQIQRYISQGLECVHVEVTGDGHHFEAIIVAEAFRGRPRVQQHRLVYEALGDRMKEEIHALSLKTMTPDEWQGSAG